MALPRTWAGIFFILLNGAFVWVLRSTPTNTSCRPGFGESTALRLFGPFARQTLLPLAPSEASWCGPTALVDTSGVSQDQRSQAASKEDRGPERWFRSSLAAGIHPVGQPGSVKGFGGSGPRKTYDRILLSGNNRFTKVVDGCIDTNMITMNSDHFLICDSDTGNLTGRMGPHYEMPTSSGHLLPFCAS